MHLADLQAHCTVGREDRLVRGCIAFSLVLLAGFAVLAGGLSLGAFGLLLPGGYFAITAITAWDPAYERLNIDTRSDDEIAYVSGDSPEAGATMDLGSVLGLRRDEPITHEQSS